MKTFYDTRDQDDAYVLKLWREEWTNAGFDTRVMTIDDARQHPRFGEAAEKLVEAYATGSNEASSFYRWLAMAASGGGWMSTYDTFPTKFHPNTADATNLLPNDGILTSFQGHVPSLVSGTAEEYDRVIERLLDTILKIPADEMKTDENALKILRLDDAFPLHFQFPPDHVHRGFAYDSPRNVNCGIMSKVKAVHISPLLVRNAINNGLYPVELSSEPIDSTHRAKAYKVFLDDWKRQCREQDTSSTTKPVMHTFFHPNSITEEAVLELWKDEWARAGFEPIVLSLDDAKRHPDFEELEKKMLTLHGETGYDSLCFYRWLAMAASGGGWMSDHDTFPVNFPIGLGLQPINGGRFTSFISHVPALLSGSEDEWKRVSKLVVDAISRIEEGKVVSDMMAFNVLKKEDTAGIIFQLNVPGETVRDGFLYLDGVSQKVDCDNAKETLAVHMSHSSVHAAVVGGSYPLEFLDSDPHGTFRRAEAAKIFLDDLRSQCNWNHT